MTRAPLALVYRALAVTAPSVVARASSSNTTAAAVLRPLVSHTSPRS